MAFERLVPDTAEWDLYYANHYARYLFTLKHLQQRGSNKVLDAATGVGYGANFLSVSGIHQVVAIDNSPAAIKIANTKFNTPGIHFLNDDCETLFNCKAYFPFDAIVSFETVEHLSDPGKFLRNCHDALKQEGLLVISTPNKLVTSPGGIKNWEFHEREFTPQELTEILRQAGFDEIRIFGQQFTSIGKLRQDLRAEINTLNFNPFVRLGKWIQSNFRGRKFSAALPEKSEDFEIVGYTSIDEILQQGADGPFVLIGVCTRK